MKGLSGQVVGSRLGFGKMSLEAGCTGGRAGGRAGGREASGRLIIREYLKC